MRISPSQASVSRVGLLSLYLNIYYYTTAREDKQHFKMDVASEFGFKIRFNLKMKTFFKRPKFLGVRIGYRLTGFAPVKESGLVLETGAGAW